MSEEQKPEEQKSEQQTTPEVLATDKPSIPESNKLDELPDDVKFTTQLIHHIIPFIFIERNSMSLKELIGFVHPLLCKRCR